MFSLLLCSFPSPDAFGDADVDVLSDFRELTEEMKGEEEGEEEEEKEEGNEKRAEEESDWGRGGKK